MAVPQRQNAQWFPVLYSQAAEFKLQGVVSGNLGAVCRLLFTLDTFPWLLYAVRFAVSYELPPAFFAANPAFKQQMKQGGVDLDFDVTIRLAQQNITAELAAHCENVQGAEGINKHPLPIPYPFRGGNKITIEATRNSSYPPIVVGEEQFVVAPTLKVTLELARGVQQIADGVSSPPAPPSTGFNE